MKNGKIYLILTIIILIIIAIGLYLLLGGNPIKKMQAEADIRNYLLQVKNYKEEDIYSISGTYSLKSNKCPYGANVTFTDEQEEFYYYSICTDNAIIQTGYSSSTPKHLE
ncbi:DUF3139 domain-containing protein [Paenibacillus polymyxa]|uniref:DUF3139 domain-containing protein n=1 Tax=Paenibacillus polymyxa TaxID=1406 RepID=UPI001BE6EDB5|nr:DUF3139 domain-containing protein [Paenibacillus polymyxa]